MAEPTPVLVPPEATPEDVYRPLSALAVASLVVAGFYAGILTILGLVAFATGTPLFYSLWTVVVPVVGLVLAVLARLRIRNAEGVLSGLALTTWAWWLSLLFGVGYVAYYVGAYLAVSHQAETFTTAWLNKIRDGKLPEAFLDTQPPEKRKSINAADTERMLTEFGISRPRSKAPLAVFQDKEIVRLVKRVGPALQITPVGVKKWNYDKGGYDVAEIYRLTTPEGDFDVSLTVRSSEGPQFEGRKWQVLLTPESLQWAGPPQLTPLGKALDSWYRTSFVVALDWLTQRNNGNPGAAFLDTLPLKERQARWDQYRGRLVLGSFFIGADWAADPLPGYKDYREGKLMHPDGTGATKLLRTDDFEALKNVRNDIISDVTRWFGDPQAIVMRGPDMMAGAEGRGWWKLVDAEKGFVQIAFPVGVLIHEPGKGVGNPLRFYCDAALILESDPGEITADRRPNWRLVGVQLIRGGTPPTNPAPGPGAGGAMAN